MTDFICTHINILLDIIESSLTGGYTSVLQLLSSPCEFLKTPSSHLLRSKSLILSFSHISHLVGWNILLFLLEHPILLALLSKYIDIQNPRLTTNSLRQFLASATIMFYLDYHNILGLFAFIPYSLQSGVQTQQKPGDHLQV